jgi:hypothetical protein
MLREPANRRRQTLHDEAKASRALASYTAPSTPLPIGMVATTLPVLIVGYRHPSAAASSNRSSVGTLDLGDFGLETFR